MSEIVPWYHARNVHHNCFGDVPIKITPNGAYTIVNALNPEYTRYIGCKVSIEDVRTAPILRDILRFVDELFTRHDITYWIYGGTLLGCIRHGNIIPWDDDVDILVLNSDAKKIASLKNKINSSERFVYAEHIKYGRNYKMYIKSREYPRLMAEIVSMFPYSVDHPDFGPFLVWKAHPLKEQHMFGSIVSMIRQEQKTALIKSPISAMAGSDNIENISTQIRQGNLVIPYQYRDNEIFPLLRKKFAGFSVNAPNQAHAILNRDYGEHSLLYGTVGCHCQWVEGKYLFKVKIDPNRLSHELSHQTIPSIAPGDR
jgi:lipopolysaccharide cholinephosphotransferase